MNRGHLKEYINQSGFGLGMALNQGTFQRTKHLRKNSENAKIFFHVSQTFAFFEKTNEAKSAKTRRNFAKFFLENLTFQEIFFRNFFMKTRCWSFNNLWSKTTCGILCSESSTLEVLFYHISLPLLY